MLAFPDVVHLLAHEFARLRRRGFSGALVSTSSFHRRFLGHMQYSVRGASRKLDAISIRVVRSFQPRAGLNPSLYDMRGTRIAKQEPSTFLQRKLMAKLARDVMTPDPACCSPNTTLDLVAKMMVQNNCGEIPIVDSSNRPVGVVTDRDIVCRVVAEGKNPSGHTAESCMTTGVVAVRADAPLDEVISTMEAHQIRRVPVVDEGGCCSGIISQADIAMVGAPEKTSELVSEISRTGRPSK